MIGLITALIFCVAVPVLAMAMLVPSLKAKAPQQPNYRGVMVYNGLGIVWFVWLVDFWVGAHLLVALRIIQPGWVTYLVPLFPLLAGACAFGLYDDWAGGNVKGFKGHLRALVHGQLTTGGLKFLGIGFLSLFTAVSLYFDGSLFSLLKVALVTCVIALFANLMNLFDLRPGRAGKVYLMLLIVAIVCVAAFGLVRIGGWDIAALSLAALGPLVAVWRFDLGEKGMIGDAGANSMGAFLGFLFATSLPIWMLAILTLGLFAINLLSERVSFSRIIERIPILQKWDLLGRKKELTQTPDSLTQD